MDDRIDRPSAPRVEDAEAEARFRVLLESAPMLAYLASDDGRCEFVNAAWRQFRGRTLAEEQGWGYLEGIHPDDLKALREARDRRRARRETTQVEIRTRRFDGQWRWLMVTATPRVVDGVMLGSMGTCVDITEHHLREDERRKLEAQLQRSQRIESLTMLAGGVAHDFNNLLMSILGNVQLSKTEYAEPTLVRERIEDIGRAARQAARLTRELLVFSGKARFEPVPLDLGEVAQEMVSLLRRSAPATVTFAVSQNARTLVVDGDRGGLGQVVLNLVTNAMQALEGAQGTIEVKLDRVPASSVSMEGVVLAAQTAGAEWVRLVVSDDGPGMQSETLARAFEPFFTTREMGRGLGLATVLGVVRAHGGAIAMTSEPGRGARVELYFRTSEGSARSLRTPGVPIVLARARVLVVDDDATVREVTMSLLTRRNFEVTAVAGGVEALALIDAGVVFDVVLLDLTMPGMSGDVVGREILRRRPSLPVVLMSGYDRDEIAPRLALIEGATYIAKPFTGSEIASMLRARIGPRPVISG